MYIFKKFSCLSLPHVKQQSTKLFLNDKTQTSRNCVTGLSVLPNILRPNIYKKLHKFLMGKSQRLDTNSQQEKEATPSKLMQSHIVSEQAHFKRWIRRHINRQQQQTASPSQRLALLNSVYNVLKQADSNCCLKESFGGKFKQRRWEVFAIRVRMVMPLVKGGGNRDEATGPSRMLAALHFGT